MDRRNAMLGAAPDTDYGQPTNAFTRFLSGAGRGASDAYRAFMETPGRVRQQVYEYQISQGVSPEMAAMRADRIAGRAGMTTGAVDLLVPQTASDVVLSAAGPIGRVAPRAGRAALGAAGAMMGMEPSEAEASVVKRAQDALRGLSITDRFRSVFPQPQRMMPEGEQVLGGRYLENPVRDPSTGTFTGQDITGQTRAGARIEIDANGRPVFLTSPDVAETPGAGGIIRTNLFRRSAGWNWVGDAPPNAENYATLVSVTHGNKHYYSLGTDFEGPVQMTRYPHAKSEPRLRPTTRGDIELGQEVGRISVRGVEHPVYDRIYGISR
jgi:hypothetical protein